MNGQVTTAKPVANSPIVCIDAAQKPFGAAGAQRGVDTRSERGVAVHVIGPGAHDESMPLGCVEEGVPSSPVRSQTGLLGRFSSKRLRRDGQASHFASIQSANLEGRP